MKVWVLLIFVEITVNLNSRPKKVNFAGLLWNNHAFAWSITRNHLCVALGFCQSPWKSFPTSSTAKVVNILEIIHKEIVYIGYQSWKGGGENKNKFFLLGVKLVWICRSPMKWSCILVIGIRNAYFINFQCKLILLPLVFFIKNV